MRHTRFVTHLPLFSNYLLVCALLLSAQIGFAQPWVDTLYTYTQSTVTYGTALDFAGNLRQLHMDICVPANDLPPDCGRPVLIAIHGGALLTGSKNEGVPQQWMKDFAKRGYVTASIEYRLGIFQPPNEVHCNVTNLFGLPWDCLNAVDTSEWIRAIYRSVQDTKGAIRYLLNHNALYGADPDHVFICGESAGGFVALATAFADSSADKPLAAYALPAVQVPNAVYNGFCVQQYGWDTSIASMKLLRPDLGSIDGDLNPGAPPFRIRAVGNFYGAITPTFLDNNTDAAPKGIYMYHQPNDLVVPYGIQKIFTGLSNCFTNLGCASIINRPTMCGSGGIKQKIDQYAALGVAVPDYWLDGTANNADCVAQVLNPSLTGHALDNYPLRTLHMAEYFATFNTCGVATQSPDGKQGMRIFPNPTSGAFTITGITDRMDLVQVYDLAGRNILTKQVTDHTGPQKIEMPTEAADGIYFCIVRTRAGALFCAMMQYVRP